MRIDLNNQYFRSKIQLLGDCVYTVWSSWDQKVPFQDFVHNYSTVVFSKFIMSIFRSKVLCYRHSYSTKGSNISPHRSWLPKFSFLVKSSSLKRVILTVFMWKKSFCAFIKFSMVLFHSVFLRALFYRFKLTGFIYELTNLHWWYLFWPYWRQYLTWRRV